MWRSFPCWYPRLLGALLLLVLGGSLSGCDYISSALPPTPSPFPTLARLPTVTPEPPSPTPQPTFTPAPPAPTPTATPFTLEGVSLVGANVRAGPGTDFDVIGSAQQGMTVTLHVQHENWFQITTMNGDEGWMAGDVLDIQPEVVNAVPTATPEP